MVDLRNNEQREIDECIRYIYDLVNHDSRKAYIFDDLWTFEQARKHAEIIEEQILKMKGKPISAENQAYIDDVREIINDNKKHYDESGK